MLDILYKKGLAGGLPNIKSDAVIFRFKDEVFEFPSYFILNAEKKGKSVVRFDGVCYVAKVKDLRELRTKHGL